MTNWTLTEKISFIDGVFGAGRLARNSINYDVRCPLCDPKDASKKKLSIRLADDALHCWVCDFRARSLLTLVKKFGSRSQFDEYKQKFLSSTSCTYNQQDFEPESVSTAHDLFPKDFRLLATGCEGRDAMDVKKYVLGRGLTERDLWYHKLGTSDEARWRRRVIVPSFDVNGQINFFVARTIDKWVRPKYDNPNVNTSSIVFNENNIDWSKELILCEGAFDCFKCDENTVPLLGSNINEEAVIFNSIVANDTPVLLALDADMWFKKTFKLAKKLAEYDINVRVVDTRLFGDPGQATREQMALAVSKARPFDWKDAFFVRLEGIT